MSEETTLNSKKTSAGIVLYNPDINRLKENIESVISQVDILILVDNASDNINDVKSIYETSNKIFFIKNEQNYGVAKALNQIVRFSEGEKCDWALLLDQDSVVPVNIIERFLRYTDIDRLGIITPNIVDRNFLNETKKITDSEYIDKCITSGSFVNLKVCKDVGYFDEEMFIDLVDFEYCARVSKSGFKILRVNLVTLIHQLGNMKVYNVFGKTVRVTNHSSLRHYYYVRNSIYYFKKHKEYLGINNMYPALVIAKKIGKILMFEIKKREKIMSVFKGIIDGVKMSL